MWCRPHASAPLLSVRRPSSKSAAGIIQYASYNISFYSESVVSFFYVASLSISIYFSLPLRNSICLALSLARPAHVVC